MVQTTTLGFPRIGRRRELKMAVEGYWKGEISEEDLLQTAAAMRKENLLLQKERGIDLVASNDFSLYDHVLDTCVLVGAIPDRFVGERGVQRHAKDASVDLETYFAMARGRPGGDGAGGAHAMEMTKWFDTNYHYIVPEISPGQRFHLGSSKPLDALREAVALGVRTKPVIVGPLSFLLLAKVRGRDGEIAVNANPLDALDRLLPVYEQLLENLAKAGATWVQIDEPCLVLDRTPEELRAYEAAYQRLAEAAGPLKIFLATYFEGLRENLPTALRLPVDALHVDLVRSPETLDAVLERGLPDDTVLSLGIVDGRNVWRTNLTAALETVARAVRSLGKERVMVAPSCSLLHVPIDLDLEDRLDAEVKGWLAFAVQKLDELRAIALAANEGKEAALEAFRESDAALVSRNRSRLIHKPHVKERAARIATESYARASSFAVRRRAQQERLGLPLLPTTTIGSFPQTESVRRTRAKFRRGEITKLDYEAALLDEIRFAIELQEKLGLDVLVHGEFERNDMVEYFAEELDGFAITRHGWVQSYGTRCVKPPILYGDVERRGPITVRWTKYAASLTKRPVKGILTGPVTILQWSFVRDDQPREETCRQIALAIRDEVRDLEEAGAPIIQIDEAALREGAPLRARERDAYFAWATACFRLASSGVRDATQIHTHMCYSEFNDAMDMIEQMDADVISIEASRSEMELLSAFREHKYERDVGPGIYDIHSPRIPLEEELVALIERSLAVFHRDQLWINPDCGLKTRSYDEVTPALRAMVNAASRVRARLSAGDRSIS